MRTLEPPAPTLSAGHTRDCHQGPRQQLPCLSAPHHHPSPSPAAGPPSPPAWDFSGLLPQAVGSTRLVTAPPPTPQNPSSPADHQPSGGMPSCPHLGLAQPRSLPSASSSGRYKLGLIRQQGWVCPSPLPPGSPGSLRSGGLGANVNC